MAQDDASEYDYDWSGDYENLDATGTLTQVGCMGLQAAVRSSDVQLCMQHGCHAAPSCCVVASEGCLQTCASSIQQHCRDLQTQAA